MSDPIYVPSSATDILATWRRHGFVPPSELVAYQEKWDYYQSLPIRKENPTEVGQTGVNLRETSNHRGKTS